MAFTVLSWDVEHFDGGTNARATTIANRIQPFNADLIAIYELESEHGGWNFARQFFPGHFTFMTEGQNTQELLILANPARFDYVAIAQRHRFRLRNPFLRPGALATVTQGAVHTNLLFLHTASGTKVDAFGDRVAMADRFFDLNKKTHEIEENGGPAARLIICGDLNTTRQPRNPATTAGTAIAAATRNSRTNRVGLPNSHRGERQARASTAVQTSAFLHERQHVDGLVRDSTGLMRRTVAWRGARGT